MHQYNRKLLVFTLAALSTLIVTPCYAQNAVDANKSSADNTTLPSASIPGTTTGTNTAASNSDDSKDSTKTNSTVVSGNNSQSTTPKANPRVPVFSRIFPMGPLMKQ